MVVPGYASGVVVVDYQVLFNVGVTLLAALTGWGLNTLSTSLRDLRNDVAKVHLEYVPKADYHVDRDKIDQRFDKLDNKIDHLGERIDLKLDRLVEKMDKSSSI